MTWTEVDIHINLKMVTAVLGTVGSIIGGWLFIDERYAHAEQTQQQIVGAQRTSEQSMIEIQLDILEDRRDRLLRNRQRSTYDNERLRKIDKRIERLEKRQDLLEQQQLQGGS